MNWLKRVFTRNRRYDEVSATSGLPSNRLSPISALLSGSSSKLQVSR